MAAGASKRSVCHDGHERVAMRSESDDRGQKALKRSAQTFIEHPSAAD